jgi:hypothetical protein
MLRIDEGLHFNSMYTACSKRYATTITMLQNAPAHKRCQLSSSRCLRVPYSRNLDANPSCNSIALSLLQAVALLQRLPATSAVGSSASTSPSATAAVTVSKTAINPWVSLLSLLAAGGLVDEVLCVLDAMEAAGVHRCEQAWSTVVIAAYRNSSSNSSSNSRNSSSNSRNSSSDSSSISYSSSSSTDGSSSSSSSTDSSSTSSSSKRSNSSRSASSAAADSAVVWLDR